MRLKDLKFIIPQIGTDAGRCYVCGDETKTGHKQAPSNAFTAWSQLYGGDVICEFCKVLFEKSHRFYPWMATLGSIRFQKPDDKEWLWPALLQPPVPSAWYITKGRQKQGWLSIVNYVSESPDRVWIGTDFMDKPVIMDTSWLRNYAAPLIGKMRDLKVTKDTLITGNFTPKMYEKLYKNGSLGEFEEAIGNAGDPRWEIAVYVHA